ncbi:MAG: YdbL family protein [Deltaproteobacteria bacterium]|nr:YdbL family protein [Candidatus Tharpella sp.]
MKTKTSQIITFTLILSSLIFAGISFAGSLKVQMRARQPKIIALKANGIIGENNRGYVEYRTAKEPRKGLMQAENQDRERVYRAIARQQNTTPEIVGRRRAAQIAERAPSGTWLQDQEGNWYRK